MKKTIAKSIGFLLLAVIGGFGGALLFSTGNKEYHEFGAVQPRTILANYSVPEATVDFTKAADLTVHAVVHVKTFYEQQQNPNNFYIDPFQQFFGRPQMPSKPAEASGSGVIISDNGYIVTNNHVVANADKVEVTLNDRHSYVAKVIGTDPSTDLALLKIEAKGLPFISFGNSDDLKVGEWVLAVGNPFNLNSTVTAGIVSAKARSINILTDPQNNPYAIESFIQTDAAVNPGNSGGALVNTRGELVGINSAIASNTGSYTGYSFAVPVNIVKKVTADLADFGEVQRAFMGVSIRDIDSKFADEKGLKELKGVYVAGLAHGGSAESAGIAEGDVILKVANIEVNSAPQLQEAVSRYRPGDKIDVTILHKGVEKVISVLLKNKNGNTEVVKKEKTEIVSLLGANFAQATADEKSKLGITGGVKITRLNPGILRNAGIREGFIVTSIDKKAIKTTEDLMNALQDKKGGILIEGVYPNGMRAYYGFGL